MAIFSLRKKTHGLTQLKLGEMVGMSQSAVGQYLNGTIPLNLMAKVTFAMALDCPITDIDPDCPYETPLDQSEYALLQAYRQMKESGNVADQELLIFAAKRSPAYQRALEQASKNAPSPHPSSIEKP